jgi:predicted glycoside hydrolase/deacetylase ChbG (UPF0249 family)
MPPSRPVTVRVSLVVTADDFGIGVETSRGIIDAHLRGPVTATSLMTVTGDRAAASVALLEQAPRLEVGLHLCLTDCGERPLALKPGDGSGLVRRDGRFHSNARLWLKSWMGRVSASAVAEEIAAQAEAFRRLTGRAPAYFDCHHHAHQLPIIRRAVVRAVAEGVLPPVARISVEPPAVRAGVGSAVWRRWAAGLIGRVAAHEFRAAGMRCNDWFFGMIDAADLERDFPWAEYLPRLPDHGVVEWVVHPGRPDDTLRGRDPYVRERVRELEALTGPFAARLLTRPDLRFTTKSAALG